MCALRGCHEDLELVFVLKKGGKMMSLQAGVGFKRLFTYNTLIRLTFPDPGVFPSPLQSKNQFGDMCALRSCHETLDLVFVLKKKRLKCD